MTTQQLAILISTIDNEIHEKKSQLQHLQAVSTPPITENTITTLPKALPPFVPPPSLETICYVRKVLQSRRLRDKKKNSRHDESIGKVLNFQINKNMFHKYQASRIQTRNAYQQQKSLNEERDLQLVAQIHGLRRHSHGVVRKLRAIRRKEELSRKGEDYKSAMESKRAIVPPLQSKNAKRNCFVSCMSPKVPDALRYVQLTSLINPWTISEKFHFLRLYLRYGKDFESIARNLTYKNVHGCVRFYYSQKLHFGLSGLLEFVQNSEIISDEELMELARKGVITASSVPQKNL